MSFTLTMPKLSPTMEEGQIVKWHKREGEFVSVGELLLEVASDKATLEFNALDEGWLRRILVKEGESAQVNAVLAVMSAQENELLEDVQEVKAESIQNVSKKEGLRIEKPKIEELIPKSSKGISRTAASPLARQLAKEQGTDLSQVEGSGPHGRILSRDLKDLSTLQNKGTWEEQLSPMRKAIGRRLLASKQTIPHFYISVQINAEPMMECREQLKTGDVSFSYNDFIVRAVALALKEHSEVNCGFNAKRETRICFGGIDLSIAVSLEEGLVTPIIFGADKKSILQISTEIKTLAKKAREGKLEEAEYLGGSFTISNLGMYGIDGFAAIINPPQGAILAVGGLNDFYRMQLTLSCDHRIIDGVAAAKFLRTLKHYLENPALLTG